MRIRSRTICTAGLLFWVGLGFVFPVWVGRAYRADDMSNPTKWSKGGTFGLDGGGGSLLDDPWYKPAPIWNPPKPAANRFDRAFAACDSTGAPVLVPPRPIARGSRATTRWPWQPVRGSHVEISWGWMSAFWSTGVIVFGIALRVIHRIRPREGPDALLSFAWSMSMTLLTAWICIVVLGILSMNLIWDAVEWLFFGVLSAGVVAGLALGIEGIAEAVGYRRIQTRSPTGRIIPVAPIRRSKSWRIAETRRPQISRSPCPDKMKQLPVVLLGALLIFWCLYEAFVPPVIIGYPSSDWGGHWHTLHVRGDVAAGFRRTSWKVNSTLIVAECSLVAVAVGLGLFHSRRSSNDKTNVNSASRAFAAAATVLHAAVIVLPLFNAGVDTIWLGRQPLLLALGVLVLWPNVIAFVVAVRLLRPDHQGRKSRFSSKLVMLFLICIACLWSGLLVVGFVGHFDVKMPLSGFVLGTVALWLTVLARALHRNERIKPANAVSGGMPIA